jgi:glycerol-3-phosphate O-acyltransferase
MILDAHSKFGADKKPLIFIPVSIAHEHIPEEAAHAKELSGAKKQKEKPTQLLKLFKLFNKKLGTVHVKFGDGIIIDKEVTDLKQETQDLAFKCFRQVGQGMLITPSSLLTLILLDEPSGALTWKQIEQKALKVIDYCQYMGIGLTNSLKDEKAIHSLRSAMDMFLNNEKVELIKREKLNQVFYTVNDTSRVHLLYHKNMILHHFFVPAVINATWFNIFNGNIKSSADLRKFLIVKRKELKYEFYLPRTTEMIAEGIRIIEYGIGRRIEGLDEVIELSRDELYKVAALVKPFSSALSYIYEAYYVSAITVKYLSEKPFTEEKFLQVAKELFEMEREHGRIVKYREAFTVPKMKATLDYLINLKIIDVNSQGAYELTEAKRLERLIEKFVTDVNDQVSINLKLGNN